MHVEIHVPRSYNAEAVFQKLHTELLKIEASLKGISFEVIRSNSRTLEGRVMIYAVIHSNEEEKKSNMHDIADKTLSKMGFEVK